MTPRLETQLEFEKRFWSHVNKTDHCWLWTGYIRTPNGYGSIRRNGTKFQAHRVSYELAYGKIPSRRIICHICDKKLCVRPDHLFIGTDLDNVNDCIRKGRRKYNYGSSNHSAKLDWSAVRIIKKLCSRGYSQRHIASLYNVSQPTICYIINEKTWCHHVD